VKIRFEQPDTRQRITPERELKPDLSNHFRETTSNQKPTGKDFSLCRQSLGVARWFIFKPKIPIWVIFGGPWTGKCLYILWLFGIFYGHLGYVMTIGYIVFIWYILSGLGIIYQ
jgi:hypothetical protein